MKIIRKVLAMVSAALCVGGLALLLIDRLLPELTLFLTPWAKFYLLAACLSAGAVGAMQAARRRRRRPK